MELEKILPKDGPPIEEVHKYVQKYKNELIVIKYGGNVFIDRKIFNNFISDLKILNKLGLSIVVVHGGGPRIKRELDKSNIKSKFIRGLRVTDDKIINIVENVLIDFNNDIVKSLEEKGTKGVSINTKNNNVITVDPESIELGFVGVPKKIESDVENFLSTEIEWLPLNKISSKGENAEDIKKLLELLEDDDDVQRVYSNFEEGD